MTPLPSPIGRATRWAEALRWPRQRGGARNPVGIRDGRATVTGPFESPGARNSAAATLPNTGRSDPKEACA